VKSRESFEIHGHADYCLWYPECCDGRVGFQWTDCQSALLYWNLYKLPERVRRKQPGFRRNKWIFASGRHAILQRYVCKAGFSQWKHPCAYSSVLAPWEFFLFPETKSILKGTHFVSVEENRRSSWTVFQKMICTIAFNIGNIECSCAAIQKAIKIIFLNYWIKIVTASVALCLWRTSYSTFATFIGCSLIVSFD